MAVDWRGLVDALLGISTYQKPRGYGPDLDDPMVKAVRETLEGQIQPLPVTKLRWYLADLEVAQIAADAGNLTPAAQLYRAMKRDGVLAGLLGSRSAGLVRLPKRFYGDTEVASALRQGNSSRSVFDEMCPPSELAAMVSDGFSLGVSVGELLPVEGRDYPILIRLEPEFLQYRWAENRWYFLSIAGALPITPGDGRWVLHIPGARMSPWHFGLWPALGRSFINKEHALLHRSNYSAKLANPARAAVAPAGATENQRLGFIKKLIAWGTNTTFELPPGWDVKLVETKGQGFEVFQSEIDTSDHEYMVSIAGQIVTTTGGMGFSNADVPAHIREDLIKADGESLSYTVNTQILPQYIASHFGGPEAISSKYTSVAWDTAEPKELESEAKTMLSVAQAVSQLAQVLSGTDRRLNLDELATRFGIPLDSTAEQSAGDVVTPQPELAAPATAAAPKALGGGRPPQLMPPLSERPLRLVR